MISHRVVLAGRHYGQHTRIRECLVEHRSSLLFKGIVREEILLKLLPKRFLPRKPEEVLLLIGDKHGANAIGDPAKFRRWGKYFDAFSLTVYPGRKVKS